jgi:hypothetical protein
VPIPEFQGQRLIKLLEQFAARKFSPRIRDKVRLEVKARGSDIIVLECRRHFRVRELETKCPIARFHYQPDGRWRLFWLHHTGRWQAYENVGSSRDLVRLVRELEDDSTHIFWG